MTHPYFDSDTFILVDYWQIRWNSRQFWYYKYFKWDADKEGYEKQKEPKLPELNSPIKERLAEFARYAKAEKQRLNTT
jgi:hypothetical protein